MKITFLLLIACCIRSQSLGQLDTTATIGQGTFPDSVGVTNCHSIEESLVRYRSIVFGEVIRISKNRYKLKIKQVIKGKKRAFNRKVTVHFGYIPDLADAPKNDFFQLELNRNYLFALGNTRMRFSTLILRNSCNRFPVENDSLFIPYQVLTDFQFEEGIDVKQEITTRDPIYKKGYKMAFSEFITLAQAVNEHYERVDGRIVSRNAQSVYSDPFIATILAQTKLRRFQ